MRFSVWLTAGTLIAVAACGADDASSSSGASSSSSSSSSTSGSSVIDAGSVLDANNDASDNTCTPGQTEPCYGGPAGTEGVGACRAGVRTCEASGAFGACDAVVPAADRCDDAVDQDCNGSACGEPTFVRTYHGLSATRSTITRPGRITRAPDGSIYVLGTHEGGPAASGVMASFGDDEMELFLSKLDANGNVSWTEKLVEGDAGSIEVKDIVADASGVYIVASQNGEGRYYGPPEGSRDLNKGFHVSKRDPGGNFVWLKQCGGTPYSTARLALNPQGGIAMSASTLRTMSCLVVLNPTETNYYRSVVALIDADGTVKTQKTFEGDKVSALVADIAFDDQGRLLLSGYVGGPSANQTPVDIGGSIPWNNTFVARLTTAFAPTPGFPQRFGGGALAVAPHGVFVVGSQSAGSELALSPTVSLPPLPEGQTQRQYIAHIAAKSDLADAVIMDVATSVEKDSFGVSAITTDAAGTKLAFAGSVRAGRGVRFGEQDFPAVADSPYSAEAFVGRYSFDANAARFTPDFGRRYLAGPPVGSALALDGAAVIYAAGYMFEPDFGKGPLPIANNYAVVVMRLGP